MAGDIKWIKVITDIFEDEKIKLIKSMPEGRTLVLIWFQLLIQAGKTNATGWIYLSEGCAYSPAMLSTLFNESQQMVELALKLFSTKPFEMIEIMDDGLIYIPNWEKHQNVESMDKIREKERLRKAKQRNKQKLLMSRDSHVTCPVTSHESHATEIELELDLELELDKEKDSSGYGGHSYQNVFGVYEREIGKLSDSVKDYLIDFELTFTEDWVKQAIKNAVKQDVKKLAYIEGTLKRWKLLNHIEPWTLEKGGKSNERSDQGNTGIHGKSNTPLTDLYAISG